MISLKKIFKFLYTTVKTIVIIFLISFALIVGLQRFSDNSIALFNYRIFSVVTGSMEPKYHVGDVLLCKYVDPSTLSIGDDITYLGKTGTFKDKIITHRIIRIYRDDEGSYKFQTQGIASLNPDPPIDPDQVYGKITKTLPFLSRLYKIVTTKGGFALCIIVPIIMLIASELISGMIEKYSANKEKNQNKLLVNTNFDVNKAQNNVINPVETVNPNNVVSSPVIVQQSIPVIQSQPYQQYPNTQQVVYTQQPVVQPQYVTQPVNPNIVQPNTINQNGVVYQNANYYQGQTGAQYIDPNNNQNYQQ